MPTKPRTLAPRGSSNLTRPQYSTHALSSAQRGLGYDHRKLRAQVLKEEPICMICFSAPSTTLDHIVPRAKGGQTVRENVRGACENCNSGRRCP